MSISPQLLELLELVETSEAKNRQVNSRSYTEELLETALKEGLIEHIDDVFRLTDRGHLEVQRHREKYIHDKYIHKLGFLGRVARFVEGNIEDWHGHWRSRHGFDENSLKNLYTDIRDLEGRVEETSNLAKLHQDEKGVIAFTLGGHGLVKRLADMGLTPGTEVTVVRSAPFHGPIEISFRGVSLALGRGVASKVFIKRPDRVS